MPMTGLLLKAAGFSLVFIAVWSLWPHAATDTQRIVGNGAPAGLPARFSWRCTDTCLRLSAADLKPFFRFLETTEAPIVALYGLDGTYFSPTAFAHAVPLPDPPLQPHSIAVWEYELALVYQLQALALPSSIPVFSDTREGERFREAGVAAMAHWPIPSNTKEPHMLLEVTLRALFNNPPIPAYFRPTGCCKAVTRPVTSPRFLYVIQSATGFMHETSRRAMTSHPRGDSALLEGTFRERKEGAVWVGGTSVHEGRNRLWEVARSKYQPLYFIFVDEDVFLSPTADHELPVLLPGVVQRELLPQIDLYRWFESFLLQYQPAVGTPALPPDAPLRRSAFTSVMYFDLMFNAYHTEAASFLMPLRGKHAELSWWAPTLYLNLVALPFFKHHLIEFSVLEANLSKQQHADFPRGNFHIFPQIEEEMRRELAPGLRGCVVTNAWACIRHRWACLQPAMVRGKPYDLHALGANSSDADSGAAASCSCVDIRCQLSQRSRVWQFWTRNVTEYKRMQIPDSRRGTPKRRPKS
eukprot:TRINITY_DN27743_c0_g1_i1.p1 TRINITY_DN27743_c0_g1~~TRINITY_DN27743_c0_g1_i1.p1  ORF type:complete len:525 (+),score=65.46 TRINITY_DN27743_c0_g1_i1:54-1628(+)